MARQMAQFVAQQIIEAVVNLIGGQARGGQQWAPAGQRQIVRSLHGEIGAGQVQIGQGAAQFPAMRRGDAPRPDPVEKGDNRRRPPGQGA